MGLSSLSGFDNFYGSNNFYGSSNQQIIIIQEEEVCHSQNIEILQQQLAIIQEFSKRFVCNFTDGTAAYKNVYFTRLILEQVCDVETQVIVLDQFQGGFSQFHHDVSRQSGRSIGYDSSISEMITEIINSDGSFNNNNFGFQGSDIGQHLIVPSGSNWNDATSPNNLNAIKQIVHHGNNVTSASRR